MNNDIINSTRAVQEGHMIVLAHPAAWYTAEGGITALDYILSGLEATILEPLGKRHICMQEGWHTCWPSLHILSIRNAGVRNDKILLIKIQKIKIIVCILRMPWTDEREMALWADL